MDLFSWRVWQSILRLPCSEKSYLSYSPWYPHNLMPCLGQRRCSINNRIKSECMVLQSGEPTRSSQGTCLSSALCTHLLPTFPGPASKPHYHLIEIVPDSVWHWEAWVSGWAHGRQTRFKGSAQPMTSGINSVSKTKQPQILALPPRLPVQSVIPWLWQ